MTSVLESESIPGKTDLTTYMRRWRCMTKRTDWLLDTSTISVEKRRQRLNPKGPKLLKASSLPNVSWSAKMNKYANSLMSSGCGLCNGLSPRSHD
jgi:hypothetical protein